jgi:hypothetical protein
MACMIMAGGCTIQEGDTRRQHSAAGLITTPPAHYSTQKARYLGEKYKEKLDRLVERIIANPKTSSLQFANNIGSSGGMGFFTHSAVKSPDERFLEVVLGTGEHFEAGDYSIKVARLFSLYGRDLLLILASDLEIYNDRELSGYGLNFTWRSLGSRVSTERAIVYFPKEKVRAFLKQDIGENILLADAVIFVIEQEGQVNLVSFRAQEPAPDVRAPIQEQILSPGLAKAKPDVKPVLARGKVNRAEGIKASPDAEESSAGEKKKAMTSGQSQTASNPISPGGSVQTVLQQKVEPIVAEKPEPVALDSAIESVTQSDKTYMPSTGVRQTTQPARLGVESSQSQFDAKATQSKLQLETAEAKTSKPSSSVDPSKEKEQKELRPEVAGSQLPVPLGELGRNKVSKPDLGIHTLPGSTEMRSSSPKESKPASEIEKLGELASISKIHTKPVYQEPAVSALITPSKLESDTVEQQPVLAHDKRVENIPEIKSLVRPMPKSLEGYIIQVAFKDRSEARRWADTFEQRGYAVSVTEAGRAESLRLRIGNFRLRDDAERQLKSIREDGLVGIILNLPQVYRPEIRSSLP